MKNNFSNATSAKIMQITNRIINELTSQQNTSIEKMYFALLRKSIGQPLGRFPDVLQLLLNEMPEEFLGYEDRLSYEEEAILTTLQLFALYQQGTSSTSNETQKENSESTVSKYNNIGTSLKALRKDENDRKAADRRFNTLITSTTYEELIYQLRHLLKLLKSREGNTTIDWGILAKDLYYFLLGYKNNLRLSWARSYYRQNISKENNDEK